MKLLHIIATPRSHGSNTLRVSNAFLEGLYARYPAMQVETLNLFDFDMPAVAGSNIEAKYKLMQGAVVDAHQKEAWGRIEELIEHFLAADAYLLTVPMWNFGIPYALKYYIDAIVQPGYTFRYTAEGRPEGLVRGRKMACITSHGGDYSDGSPFQQYDFVKPYLTAVFGWIGIQRIQFVSAQPMDYSPEIRQAAISAASAEARALAERWEPFEAVNTIEIAPLGLKPKPLIE